MRYTLLSQLDSLSTAHSTGRILLSFVQEKLFTYLSWRLPALRQSEGNMAKRSAVELSSFGSACIDDSDAEDDETARLTRGAEDGETKASDGPKVGTRTRRGNAGASSLPRASAATQTAAYTVGFVVLGLMVGMIGPALPELRENVGVSFERLGAVFFFRWLGSISGSALGGKLLDARPRSHVPYAASVLVAAVGAALIPVARSLRAIVAAFLVMDFGLGVLIVHGNTLCVWANADNPAPAVNVINGGFGAGAFCAPLALVAARASGGGVREAYWCVALASAATAYAFLRVPAPGPPEKETAGFDAGSNADPDADSSASVAPPLGVRGDRFGSNAAPETPSCDAYASSVDVSDVLVGGRLRVATASIVLFLALAVGVEISFGTFLVAYARAVGTSQSEADLMTTAFWGSFTCGRIAMASFFRRVRPAPTLAAHLAIATVSLSVVLAGRGDHRATLWFGSLGFGAGVSSLFAAAVAQLHEVSGGVRGSAGGWIGVGASSGTLVQMAVSRVSGSPDALMGTLLVLTVSASAVLCGGVWGPGRGFRRSFAPALIDIAT